MDLQSFLNASFDLDTLRDLHELTADESAALADLLAMTLFADQRVSDDELSTLAVTWSELPYTPNELDRKSIYERQLALRNELSDDVDDVDDLNRILKGLAARFTSEEKKMAAMRLVAMMASVDGFDEQEIDFCFGVGHALDLDHDLVDNIIRSAWNSRQTAMGQGPEHKLSAEARRHRQERRGVTEIGLIDRMSRNPRRKID